MRLSRSRRKSDAVAVNSFLRNAKLALKLVGLFVALGFLGLLMQVVAYRFVPVTDTCYMRAQATKNGVCVTQRWMPLERISDELPLAVVSSEDNLFTKHHGFCWSAIKKAMNRNSRGKKVFGASTISQQTAKNVFLWNGRSWLRKGLEAVTTVLIEALWGKERIMEVYLNVVEFGPGVYGAEAAARRYFHHSAQSIGRREAALMAAVMPNPVKMKLAAPSPYVEKRCGQIMSLMRKIGSVRYDGD